MDKWKAAISAGNLAFDQYRDADAEAQYRTACIRSEQLLTDWNDVEEVTAALVISYQNLADLYFRGSRVRNALEAYKRLNQQLLKLHDHHANRPDRQAYAERARKKIGTELMYLLRTKQLYTSDTEELLKQIAQKPELNRSC